MFDLPDLSSHGLPDYSGFETRTDYFVAKKGRQSKLIGVFFIVREQALADEDPDLYHELAWDMADDAAPTEAGENTLEIHIYSDDPKRVAKIRGLEGHFLTGVTLNWGTLYEDD
jgi:hypothetical protein